MTWYHHYVYWLFFFIFCALWIIGGDSLCFPSEPISASCKVKETAHLVFTEMQELADTEEGALVGELAMVNEGQLTGWRVYMCQYPGLVPSMLRYGTCTHSHNLNSCRLLNSFCSYEACLPARANSVVIVFFKLNYQNPPPPNSLLQISQASPLDPLAYTITNTAFPDAYIKPIQFTSLGKNTAPI